MSDRKYRQRGYQDEGKPSRGPQGPKPPRPPQRARARAPAAGRTRPEDARISWARTKSSAARAAGICWRSTSRSMRALLALRRRPACVHPVRVVRHERTLGMHAARQAAGAGRAEGRAQPVHAVHAAHDGRAADRDAAGQQRLNQPQQQRPPRLRRSVQVISVGIRDSGFGI